MARVAACAAGTLGTLTVAASTLASLPPVPRAAAPLQAGGAAVGPDDAGGLDGFVQVAPLAGARPTRRTQLRMVEDGRALHIRVRASDPEPAAIVAQQMRRDVEGMLAEDQVTLVIDPDGDGRNGYLFAVNAHGAQFDALIFDGGQMRFDWDALWHSEAGIDADGWWADITLPLSVFGRRGGAPGGVARTWRFNAERWMPRGSERVRLAGIQPDKAAYSLGDALPMPAIDADLAGWGLRVKPSVRAQYASAAASGTGQARQRLVPGLELFHESPSGLRTAAALNIDFGEAEADERTVNLSRFELFRPEKREFFLRDAGRFTFGGLVDTAVVPYYSRRIGLDDAGRARSLDAGLKFSGQLAGLDFGLFGARVAGGPLGAGLPEQTATEVGVLRVARPLSERSRLGMIATQGNPQGTAGSRLWGVDYQYRDTDWAWSRGGQRGKTLEAHAWLQRSDNAGLGTGRAWGGSVQYPNLGLKGSAEWQRIDEQFNPALGYLAERGVTRGQGEIGWWHRTAAGADIVPAIDWNLRRKLDGTERSWLMNPELGYTTAAGDTVMAEVFFEGDRPATPYTLVPGVTVQPGSYRWQYLFGYLETSPSRPVSAIAELRSGSYYDGHRDDQTVQLAWQSGPHWGWRIGAARNAIRLPSGEFTVRTASLRLDHTPSTRLAQSLLLQWDNVSQSLGASARLRWLHWLGAGTELIFAVDRLGYTGELRGVQPQQTQALLKLVWNFEP